MTLQSLENQHPSEDNYSPLLQYTCVTFSGLFCSIHQLYIVGQKNGYLLLSMVQVFFSKRFCQHLQSLSRSLIGYVKVK